MKHPTAFNRFLRSIFIAPATKKLPKRRVARRESLESRLLLTSTLSVDVQNNAAPGVPGVFTIGISPPVNESVTISYSLSGTAAGTDDPSIPSSGSVTLNPEQPTATVSINPSANDNDNDGGTGSPESLTLSVMTISAADVFGVGASATMTVTETDDGGGGGGGGGGSPTVTIGNAPSADEGTSLSFPVTVSNATGPVTVNWSASSNDSNDYASTSNNTMSFSGNGTQTLSISLGDDPSNGIETQAQWVSVTATLGTSTSTATGSITEDGDDGDGGGPSITVSNNGAQQEGSPIGFTINYYNMSSNTSLTYSTQDGSALAGTDYTAIPSTPTTVSGTGSFSISVPTADDGGSGESSQTFTLNASADGVSGSAIGTIDEDSDDIGDGGTPWLTVSSPSATEGGSMTFQITASGFPAYTAVSLNTQNGSAYATTDYDAVSTSFTTDGTGAGSTSVTVQTLDDKGYGEAAQEFTLAASAEGYTAYGTGTITEDADPPGTLTVSSPSALEGTALNFTITASGWDPNTALSYSTGTGTAVNGFDYYMASGNFSVDASGSASVTIPVTTLDDNGICEDSETVVMNAYGPGGASASGTGAIIEDDDGTAIDLANATSLEDSGQIVFPVTLNEASSQTVTVDYTTVDGTGADGASQSEDYTKTSGTVIFTPGVTQQSITVPLIADAWHPNSETFQVQFSNPIGAPLCDSDIATGTILQGPAPTISIDSPTAAEGATETFDLTLSAPTEQTTTVSYATENGSALAGTDYTDQSGTVTFAPGQTSATLTVATTDDIWGGESNEFFYVNLSNPQNATLANSQATGTITEDGDDVLPSISVTAQPALESSGWMMFAITLSATIDAPIAVDYATADGIGPDAAISGEDYAGGSGTLTFNPGEAGIDLWFGLNRDPWFNADETFSLNLSNPTHAVIAVGSATGTIQQGPPPTLSIGAGTANESAGAISFPVTLSEASGVTTTVDYATSDGVGADAALAGEDYTTTTGTLSFAPGVTTQTITVPLLPDAYHAGNETFQVALANPQNATLATATASGTIAQGPPPAISIADATANEGAVETFTLTLSQASDQAITVQYSTADGSAKASTDYTAVSNATATFAAGTTQTTIAVPTSDDDTMVANEANETFVVNLSNPQGATLGAARGTATIVEDADQPSISIADASGPESGGSLTFVVTTSPPSNTAVTVNYATADGTGANAALSGEDYAHTTGTITLNPGVTSQNISVPLYNDTYHPADETFFVNLSSASNAAIGRAQAIGAIQQGPLPTISIADASQTEPASGSLLIYFSVTLSRIEDVPVTVAYATADGAGTDGATSPEDYTAASGTVTFNPGETQHTVGITLNSDPYHPANETFFVNLSAPTNATVARGQAIGNITQGPPPGMVIGSAWADEGSTVVFPITLYGTSDEAITFAYQTADGSATAGMDYASSSGTATIPAGQTGTTISVPTLDDDAQITNEPNQTFYLNLSNPQGATLESSQGTGTVIEDNDRPSISVADVSAPESAGSLTFTVTLSTPSATTVFVNYATADGAWPDAAIGGEDYGWTGGGLAFAPGVTSQSVTVPLYNDAYHPADENFFFNLSSATNATIARYQATGTIVQGAPPTVSIADASQQEPASGSAAMNFTLTLSQAADVPVTVNYTTADGSAVAAQGDYQPVTGGTVTFPAGRTQATASVSINADELDGLNEQFYVNLGDPQNATIARGTATGTILEVNGGQPTISITGDTEPETAGQLAFTVSLSAPTTQSVKVDFNTSDGTAVSSEDYTAIPPGTITFAPGQTSQTVQVSLASDPWSATDEIFYGNLSNPVGATIAVAQATGTITQGQPPNLNIDDVTGKETDGSMVFTVTLSQKSAQDTTVSFNTEDVTAKAGEDYTATSGILTIPPNELSGTIAVPIIDDKSKDDVPGAISSLFGWYEPPTEFWLLLSSPQGAQFGGTNVGIGTIYDPDDPNAPVTKCTCSCACGNVTTEPTNADGDNVVHESFPLATSDAVTAPDGESGPTELGLTYDDQEQPHPIVTVPDVLSPDVAGATAITAQLTLGGIVGAPVYYSPAGYAAGQMVVFAAQVDAGTLATGTYGYTMTISEQYADGHTVVRAYNGQQNIENLDQSPAGAGWMLRGMPRLYLQSGGVNLSDGAGNLYFFTQNPDGTFTRPAGEPGFSTLVKNGDGSFTLTDKYQNVSQFSSQGFLTSVTDTDGNATTVVSDSSGNPLSITDSAGRTTSFGYIAGLLSSVTDFSGRTVTLTHDAGGHLTQLSLPDPGNGETQSVTTFDYDSSSGQMTSLTDSTGTTSFAYNSWRELTQTTAHDDTTNLLNAPLGQALVDTAAGVGTADNPAPLVYASSLVGSQTDENGKTSSFTPGPFGEDASDTDALGQTISTTYNAEGEPLTITAPALVSGGQPLVTTNVYDTMGNTIETDFPDGTSEHWTIDPKFNEPTKYVDRAGRETDYTLDSTNGDVLDVIQVSASGNLTTSYTYTPKPTQAGQPPAGLVAKEIDPRGIETDYSYTDHGQVSQIVYAVGTPDQASVEFSYNGSDDLVSSTDELNRTTNFVVDGMGRTIQQLDPPPDPNNPSVRPVTQTVFDAKGEVVETIDPMNRATFQVWDESVGEDDPAKLLKVEAPDPAGGTNYTTTHYVYAGNNLVETIDPMGRITADQFDAAGQQIAEQAPSPVDGSNNQTFVRATASGPVTSVVYDTAGDTIQEFDPAGGETDNVFDSNGQLLSTTGPAPTAGAARPITAYVYNGDGQIVSQKNALGQSVWLVYDDFGQKIEEIDPSPSNPLAAVNPLSPPADAPIKHWGYDPDGNLVIYVDPRGATYKYVYNNRNERVEEDDPSPDGGQTPGAVWHWVYDKAGELTEEIDPMQRVTQWVHDGDGNIIQTILPNVTTGGEGDASTTTYDTYDLDGEKLTETTSLPAGASGVAMTSWQFDDLGDVVQETGPVRGPGQAAPVTSWTLNADQEVVKEVDPLGRSQTTTLDGLGRATQTTSFEGVTEQFGYDALSNLVTTSDASGTVTHTFDGLSRETKTVDQAGGTTQMSYDLLSNMTSLVDPAGNKTSWQRDGLNQVTSDTNQLGASDTFSYDTAGDVTQEVDKDGRVRTFQYNTLGQQTLENWLATTAGASATVSTITDGYGGATDTVETVLPPQATGGTWTLSLNAQSTAPIAWNATPEQIDTAVTNAFPNEIANWAAPYGSDPMAFWFGGDYTGELAPPLVADTAQLTGLTASPQIITYVYGHLGTDTEYDLSFVPTVSGDHNASGSFTLSLHGATTSAIPYNADGSAIAAAIEALPGVYQGDVWASASDEGGYTRWRILFCNAYATVPLNGLTVSSSTVAGAAGAVSTNFAEVQVGQPGADEVQDVVINAVAGTFRLMPAGTFGTTPLPYNATAAQVQAALNLAITPSFSPPTLVDVTGAGTAANPYVITFVGADSGVYEPQMYADGSDLLNSFNVIATAYNADGEITSTGDNFSHYAYTYTGQGDVASVDNAGTPGVPDVVLTSGYDAAGNRKSLSATIAGTKDFLTSYSYNTLSQLDEIDQQGQSGGNAVAMKSIYFGLDAIGDITQIDRSNSVYAGPNQNGPAYSLLFYSPTTGLLTGINHEYMGTSLDNLSYTYDTLARVSTFGSIDGTATYGYDATSQVVSASYTTAPGGHQPANEAHSYDPNGNQTTSGFTVGADNHLTSDGTFNFTFDPAGNLSTRVRISNATAADYKTVYLWDYRDRLTDVEFFNNSGVLTQHVHYAYDVWDHLIERDLDPNGSGTYTQTVHYVWDGDNIALSFDGHQNLIARYLNGPDTSAYDQYFSPLAEEDVTSLTSQGTVSYSLLDQQGTLRDEVDANGSLIYHAVYESYGATTYESNSTTPHLTGWQGGLTDSVTGMENFDHRWYILADAVWASQDPLGFSAGDTNLSRLVGNDPANFTDSSGQMSDELTKLTTAAKKAGLPTEMVTEVNRFTDTSVVGGRAIGGERFHKGRIELTDAEFAALQSGELTAAQFAAIYNEVFHAYMAGFVYPGAKKGGPCKWIYDLMVAENYLPAPGPPNQMTALAEEAMSDVVSNVISDLMSYKKRFDDATGEVTIMRGPDGKPELVSAPSVTRDNANPGHEESTFKPLIGQKSKNDPKKRKGTTEQLSPNMVMATMYLLYNGCRDPAPGKPLAAKLAVLNNWYSLRFGPQRVASPAEVVPGLGAPDSAQPPLGTFPPDKNDSSKE